MAVRVLSSTFPQREQTICCFPSAVQLTSITFVQLPKECPSAGIISPHSRSPQMLQKYMRSPIVVHVGCGSTYDSVVLWAHSVCTIGSLPAVEEGTV